MRFLKTVAILSASAAGILAITVGAQAQQGASPQGPACTVTVERDQADGVLDVTRQVFNDGTCNCFIYTGSEAQPNNIEGQVLGILQSRRCPNARPMTVDGPGTGLGAGAGGGNLLPVALGFGAAAASTILIIEDNDRSSP